MKKPIEHTVYWNTNPRLIQIEACPELLRKSCESSGICQQGNPVEIDCKKLFKEKCKKYIVTIREA